jgi:hypothetical protein
MVSVAKSRLFLVLSLALIGCLPEEAAEEPGPDAGADVDAGDDDGPPLESTRAAAETWITGGPSGPTSSNDPVFSFAGTTGGFQCRLDLGVWAACSSPRAYVDLADGGHTFAVRACNPGGVCDPTPATRSFTIDTVPPDTTITSGPPSVSSSSSASFSFTGTGAPTSFQCRVDGGAYAACASPRTVIGLASGTHTFWVRGCDAVGNCDPTPAVWTWTIDTIPPTATITGGPTGVVASTSATFTFIASEAGATFQCRLDGGASAACLSPVSYSGLASGGHSFSVHACDVAGNCSSPAVRSWTVDVIAPETTITSGPIGPVASTSASFTFAATEGGATFQCSRDGAPFAACASPLSYSGLAEGAHTFSVRACDAAGNCDASPATRSWAVDTTPPNTVITTGPANPSSSSTASFSFTSTEPGTFLCSLDGGAASTCSSPATYAGLADGVHWFTVRACDAAGNCDATPAAREWVIASPGLAGARRTPEGSAESIDTTP